MQDLVRYHGKSTRQPRSWHASSLRHEHGVDAACAEKRAGRGAAAARLVNDEGLGGDFVCGKPRVLGKSRRTALEDAAKLENVAVGACPTTPSKTELQRFSSSSLQPRCVPATQN